VLPPAAGWFRTSGSKMANAMGFVASASSFTNPSALQRRDKWNR